MAAVVVVVALVPALVVVGITSDQHFKFWAAPFLFSSIPLLLITLLLLLPSVRLLLMVIMTIGGGMVVVAELSGRRMSLGSGSSSSGLVVVGPMIRMTPPS